MFKLPDYSSIKFPDVKLPDFKLPDFKLPDFKLPDFKLPDFKLPDFKFPAIDFPTIDFAAFDFSGLDVNALRDLLPSIDTTKLTDNTAKLTGVVRDAAYIAIGLGVTSVERAQARREQLTAIITEGLDKARGLRRTTG